MYEKQLQAPIGAKCTINLSGQAGEIVGHYYGEGGVADYDVRYAKADGDIKRAYFNPTAITVNDNA